MMYADLIQPATEALTTLLVNKIERGNALVLFPLVLAACWVSRVRTNYRRRRWLNLTPEEQFRRQRAANKEGRHYEMYPL